MAEQTAEIYTTPLFIVSYPNLDKPSKMEGSASDPKYGVTQLYTPANFSTNDQERWTRMRRGSLIVLREKFGDKAFDAQKKILPIFKMPFRSGMEKPDKTGYGAGVTFLRAGNKNPPGMAQMINGGKVKIDWSKFYPGCYARASISFWAFDNKSKGVAVNLHNLLFVGDGERFGQQGPDIESDFTDLGEDEISFGDATGDTDAAFGTADDELAF